nr:hypothetical protein CFP56_09004 [Quercus suber]
MIGLLCDRNRSIVGKRLLRTYLRADVPLLVCVAAYVTMPSPSESACLDRARQAHSSVGTTPSCGLAYAILWRALANRENEA